MTPLETVREVYRAMRAGDDAGFTWHGAAAVIENVFHANARRWTGFSFTEEEIFGTSSRVVVLGHYSGTSHATGKAMRAAVAHVYDLREGKICRFRMFADTHPMWEALSA